MRDAPCKGCEKRTLGCHGSCDEYKAFREERDKVIRKRQAISLATPSKSRWVLRKIKRREMRM